MFGKLGDMMGKLQEMKQRADELKRKLDEVIIKTEGAGGDVKIEMTGNRKVMRIEISNALQFGNKQELENTLLNTMNKALADVEKMNEEEMKKAASGMLPGL